MLGTDDVRMGGVGPLLGEGDPLLASTIYIFSKKLKKPAINNF